jgi:hypothetical protein
MLGIGWAVDVDIAGTTVGAGGSEVAAVEVAVVATAGSLAQPAMKKTETITERAT